jgi:choline dehydrogenase-like flavoprotein
MNNSIKSRAGRTCDAIVVGTGISGGWAEKELTEERLKTLVLERGRMVRHIEDYPIKMKPSGRSSCGDRFSLNEPVPLQFSAR